MQERKFALMTLSASKDASEKAEWHQHLRRTTPFSDHPTQRVRRHLLRSSRAPRGAQLLCLRGAHRGGEVRAGFPAGKHRLTIIKVKELILSLVNKITNSSNGDTTSV